MNSKYITKIAFTSAILLSGLTPTYNVEKVQASGLTPSFVIDEKVSWEEKINNIATSKIQQRLAIADQDFTNIQVEKVKRMKDVNEQYTKYMVILEDLNSKSVAGYMIVDGLLDDSDAVVEFALGDVYPGYQNPNQELYYFGSVQYGFKDQNNKVKDLRENKVLDDKVLDNIRTYEAKKYKEYHDLLLESATQESVVRQSSDYSIATVVNRVYKKISGVPDYQQDDYPYGANDCTPVSAGNIVMYWDSNGYPNMSSDNVPTSVIGRLANFMGTTASGTPSASVEPGLDRYLQERYPNANSDRRGAPTWSNLTTEINAGRPTLLHLSGYDYTSGDLGHTVTLVGTESYQETTENLKYYYNFIIHDNWKNTPTDVWLSWGRGAGSVYAHTVVFPN